MMHLGCIWWKKLSSSLKTFFTHFELTFVYLMSGHEIWDFPRFTWCNVNKWSKTHLVTHIFITDNKSHHFQKSDNICALQRCFCDLYRFLRSTVLMGGHLNLDGHKLKTIIQKTFPTFFLNSQSQWQVGKSIVKSK